MVAHCDVAEESSYVLPIGGHIIIKMEDTSWYKTKAAFRFGNETEKSFTVFKVECLLSWRVNEFGEEECYTYFLYCKANTVAGLNGIFTRSFSLRCLLLNVDE